VVAEKAIVLVAVLSNHNELGQWTKLFLEKCDAFTRLMPNS
jgi:hypothetical protein